jgi:hypothetical protein
MAFDAFKPGDRVELVRYYSFWGDPPPRATVVGITNRCVMCKMDRNGKLIRFLPGDLRHIGPMAPRERTLAAEKFSGTRHAFSSALPTREKARSRKG